jgi:hypothetical protein
MREKLIALLKSNQVVLQAAGTSATATLRLADHLIANSVTVQKWIPVTERLPLSNTYVNVTTDGVVAQAYWHNDRFYAFTAIGVATVVGVTHWMPLPEPPKEKDNE